MTGYQLVALGVGQFHLINDDGKWQWQKKQLMPGAAAQYVGIKKDRSDKRAILMLSGGLMVHVGLILLLTSVGLIFDAWRWCLPYILLNIGFLLLNAAPDGITDGAKIWELYRYPDHVQQLYQALDHAAQVYVSPDTASLADFYDDNLPLEPGGIYQTYILNKLERAILEGDTGRALQGLQGLRDFTENRFIRMCSTYLMFEAQLLTGNLKDVEVLAKDKLVKKMLAQPQASIKTIKAKYEWEVLGDKKKARKSLKMAEKAFTYHQLLMDEKLFYGEIYEAVKEQR